MAARSLMTLSHVNLTASMNQLLIANIPNVYVESRCLLDVNGSDSGRFIAENHHRCTGPRAVCPAWGLVHRYQLTRFPEMPTSGYSGALSSKSGSMPAANDAWPTFEIRVRVPACVHGSSRCF